MPGLQHGSGFVLHAKERPFQIGAENPVPHFFRTIGDWFDCSLESRVVDGEVEATNVSIVCTTNRSTSAATETSVGTDMAFPPRASISVTRVANSSARRAAAMTLAPLAANASVVARPIPLLAPVISATLPSIFGMLILPASVTLELLSAEDSTASCCNREWPA